MVKVDAGKLQAKLPPEQLDRRIPEGKEVYSDRVIVFDIETGPLPWAGQLFDPRDVKMGNIKQEHLQQQKLMEAQAKFTANAALDACTGEILTTGYLFRGEYVIEDRPEVDTIKVFFDMYRKATEHRLKMAGWSIESFDLGFITRRAWIHGIPIPTSLMQISRGRTYYSEIFMDLEKIWIGPRNAYEIKSSADHVAAGMGIVGKLGESGGNFAGWWRNDRPRAVEYLKRDLYREFAIGRRMGVI